MHIKKQLTDSLEWNLIFFSSLFLSFLLYSDFFIINRQQSIKKNAPFLVMDFYFCNAHKMKLMKWHEKFIFQIVTRERYSRRIMNWRNCVVNVIIKINKNSCQLPTCFGFNFLSFGLFARRLISIFYSIFTDSKAGSFTSHTIILILLNSVKKCRV